MGTKAFSGRSGFYSNTNPHMGLGSTQLCKIGNQTFSGTFGERHFLGGSVKGIHAYTHAPPILKVPRGIAIEVLSRIEEKR